MAMMDYAAIAGQLIASGVDTNIPLANFETGETVAVQKVRNLMLKLNLFIHDTKVWGNPLAALENRKDELYGAGLEMAAFNKAATNKKLEDGLFPYGDAEMSAQLVYNNYAYNIPMTLADYEINASVRNAAEAGKYAAGKMATVAKAIGQHGYNSYKRILSNVVDGTNTFTTKENSDGTGNAVTYALAVKGYCGKVLTPDVISAAPVRGQTSSIEDSDALELVQLLASVAEDFKYEGTDYNKLGIETFSSSKPWLVMETKTLTAMDNAFMMNAGYKGFPTVDARTCLNKDFKIMEIDAFPDKPVTAPVTTTRIGALVLDPGVMIRSNRWENAEATRDGPHRRTGYSYRCEAGIWMDQAVNSCAVLVKPTA